MKTYIDCVPCFFRQIIEASKMAGLSDLNQKKVVDELAAILPGLSFDMSPPEVAKVTNRIVQKYAKRKDVYKNIKEKSNRLGMKLYKRLLAKVSGSKDPLAQSVEIAIAGNIIDYGAKNHCDVDRELDKMFAPEKRGSSGQKKEVFHYKQFVQRLKKAKDILYLADNAGETVFDRVFIETIKKLYPEKNIVYAVKERPIINDALKQDALFCGIDKNADIISSGSDAPGTVLSLCSDKFIKLFNKAEMIISKGQGNFEALLSSKRPIFFLFMVKCAVVSELAETEIGQRVLMFNPEAE